MEFSHDFPAGTQMFSVKGVFLSHSSLEEFLKFREFALSLACCVMWCVYLKKTSSDLQSVSEDCVKTNTNLCC